MSRGCTFSVIASILALVISLFANAAIYNVSNNNREALCALRSDVQKRHDNGVQFLKQHPRGIPGIDADAIKVSLKNQQATLDALSGLDCD